MADQNTKPRTTKDYLKFKFKHGNRPVDQAHVKKLMSSMSEVYVPQTIYVNKRYEITDGQHRFTAAKALGLPITYMVTDHSLDDIRRMNQNTKNWTLDDFLDSYVTIENKKDPNTVGPYGVFKHFKQITGFPNAVCLMMLGETGYVGVNINKQFKEGKFNIPSGNFEIAKKQAKQLHKIGEYYDGWKRRSFINAMLSLFKDEAFEFKQFIRKLEFNRSKLYHCTTVSDYIDTIERLYNWGNKNKVKFRRFNEQV
jgi:hypothetical protein